MKTTELIREMFQVSERENDEENEDLKKKRKEDNEVLNEWPNQN